MFLSLIIYHNVIKIFKTLNKRVYINNQQLTKYYVEYKLRGALPPVHLSTSRHCAKCITFETYVFTCTYIIMHNKTESYTKTVIILPFVCFETLSACTPKSPVAQFRKYFTLNGVRALFSCRRKLTTARVRYTQTCSNTSRYTILCNQMFPWSMLRFIDEIIV